MHLPVKTTHKFFGDLLHGFHPSLFCTPGHHYHHTTKVMYVCPHKLNTTATECMLTKSIKHKKQDGKANPNWLMHKECHLPTLSRIAEVWRSSSCFSAVAINGFRVLTSKYSRHLSFSSCSLACTIVQHNDAKYQVAGLWSLLLSPILHAEGGRLFQLTLFWLEGQIHEYNWPQHVWGSQAHQSVAWSGCLLLHRSQQCNPETVAQRFLHKYQVH